MLSDTTDRHVHALDGVRGLAVILVFLFHLRVAGFRQGYLGVDIFFVLSGFLITSLLIAERERDGHISLTKFWARRVRRLLPALAVMLVVVAIVGHIVATPSEQASLRGDLLATTSYVANWRFIATSSYFNSTGVTSPLQHTWSLAIEEQFYLLWPLLIVAAIAVVKRPRPAVLLVASIGIVAAIVRCATLYDPSAVERTYMGTDTRMLEPMIGAAGAVLVTSPRWRQVVERHGRALAALGCLGIVAGLALLHPDVATYYDGGAALFSLATLGLVAAVWTGRGGVTVRALEWRPLVGIGVISYGIYLWHWPLIVWSGDLEAHGLGAAVRGVVVVVSTVVIALVSYMVIERPIRRGGASGTHARRPIVWRPAVVLASVPVILASVAGVSIAATSVPPRRPERPSSC